MRHSNFNVPLVTSGVNGIVEMTLFVFVFELSYVEDLTGIIFAAVPYKCTGKLIHRLIQR